MQNVDYQGNRPMSKMVERIPMVAEVVLDKCIEYSRLEKEHADYNITYHFDFLTLPPETAEKEDILKYCGPSVMAKFNRENLLAHPVTISYVNSRWKLLPRHMYYLSLGMYYVFLTLLTILVFLEKHR